MSERPSDKTNKHTHVHAHTRTQQRLLHALLALAGAAAAARLDSIVPALCAAVGDEEAAVAERLARARSISSLSAAPCLSPPPCFFSLFCALCTAVGDEEAAVAERLARFSLPSFFLSAFSRLLPPRLSN